MFLKLARHRRWSSDYSMTIRRDFDENTNASPPLRYVTKYRVVFSEWRISFTYTLSIQINCRIIFTDIAERYESQHMSP